MEDRAAGSFAKASEPKINLRLLVHPCSVVLCFLLLFCAFFSNKICQNQLLALGDAVTYSLPAFFSRLSLWNDLVGCGVPIAADPQYQMWYPLRLLCRLLSDYNSLVIAGYAIAASTAYAFTLALTRSKMAAAVGALTYSLSGFMFAHLGHITIIHAAAWLPLLLLSMEKIKDKFKWPWILVGELSVALCTLGGHSQILLMQLVVGGLYTVFLAADNRTRLRSLFASFFTMCFFGLALVGLQLVPTLELASFSPRNQWSFESFVSFSLPPRQLAQFFFPFLFYKPVNFAFQAYGQSPYFGAWSPTELAGYVGILPLMLAFLALVKGRRRQKLFWLTLAVASLIVAAGEATPLAKVLFQVPVINHFRCPARCVLLFDLAIAVLAAFGISAVEKASSRGDRRRSIALAAGAFSVVAISAFIWCLRYLRFHFNQYFAGTIDLSPLTNASVGIPILLFALSFMVALFWSANPLGKFSRLLLLSMMLLDFSSFDYFCEWRYVSVSAKVMEPSSLVLELLREQKETASGGFRILAPLGDLGGFASCPPNLPSLWGLSAAANYSPLCTAQMARIFHSQGSGRLQLSCRYNDAAADLAAVKYLIVPQATPVQNFAPADVSKAVLPFDQPVGSAPRFEVSKLSDSINKVYLNKRYLPRFRLVHHGVYLADAAAADVIATSRFHDGARFDTIGSAIVDEPDAPINLFSASSVNTTEKESVIVLNDDSSAKTIEVACLTDGLLVIADQFYPGWSCTVDGKRSRLLRTNYAFQGVPLNPGRHTVQLRYEPASFYFGLALTAFTALLNFVGVVALARRSVARKTALIDEVRDTTA